MNDIFYAQVCSLARPFCENNYNFCCTFMLTIYVNKSHKFCKIDLFLDSTFRASSSIHRLICDYLIIIRISTARIALTS